MRFLCLHGMGTNSQIFETQTAALRFELGDNHTYEFVEGAIAAEVAPELQSMLSSTDDCFSYLDFDDMDSCNAALDQLDAYLTVEGPFDAVLAFSQGATIAATYIVRKLKANSELEKFISPFKCAVFFSAGGAYDPNLLLSGEIRLLTQDSDGEMIPIPTVHVWGRNDTAINAAEVSGICDPGSREVFVHEGGHEIPGARMNAEVKSIVRAIRRVVYMASVEE
ncbi:DUF341 domain protein [Hypomontagnella monticulosa]|nr:DUF341 domain protein [Hypomontagnella monticulosa]